MTDVLDIPACAFSIKDWFKERPSKDTIIEIQEFIARTGTPHLWRGQTEHFCDQRTIAVYVRSASLGSSEFTSVKLDGLLIHFRIVALQDAVFTLVNKYCLRRDTISIPQPVYPQYELLFPEKHGTPETLQRGLGRASVLRIIRMDVSALWA
jgi:hypothetical protein